MNTKLCGCEAVLENGVLHLSNPLIQYEAHAILDYTASCEDAQGCSLPFMEVQAQRRVGTPRRYRMWQDLPLVWLSEAEGDTLMTLTDDHWIIRDIKLNAFTDEVDTLTETGEMHLFDRGLKDPREGDIFFLENIETGNAVILISETPDFAKSYLTIQRKEGWVKIQNQMHPIVIGYCRVGECEALCRSYFRHANKRPTLVTMSNTWGNNGSRDQVRADFLIREVDAAHELGVDIVQIDDGWSIGPPFPKDAQRRNICEGNCWDVNTEKFPNGIREVTDYAAKYGIRVGLWFLPYSKNNFEMIERDLSILRTAYEEWGIRFFKIDLYYAETPQGRDSMLYLLKTIHSFGPDVSVQLDTTRFARLNYLCGREFGTIFVENRYTMIGSSFPHRVLRNLWMISRYMPSSRFQFEVIDPDLNTHVYRESDPFAPRLFDMDYLFATTMLSNPLFWMYMQNLSEKRRAELAPLMKVWRECRRDFVSGDVCPIGEKPSGRSLTGFVVTDGQKPTYLLLFREVTDREGATFSVPGLRNGMQAEVLASNTDASATVSDGTVAFSIKKMRGYALIKLI